MRLGYIPDDPQEYGVTYFNHDSRQGKIVKLVEAKESRSHKYAIDSSRCNKGRNGVATATHEFAHILYQFRTPDVAISGFDADIRMLFSEYKNAILKGRQTQDYSNMAEWYLGEYSGRSEGEFMAEAFQEYRNCKKPTKYALAVGRLIDKYFKR